MAKLQLTSVTIGCPDPPALAKFYARLLRADISDSEPGWAQVRTSSEYGKIRLNFELEEQWRTPVWPSEPDNQHITQHLDIHVDDLDGAVAWAIQCGARLAEFQPQEDVRVMLDPAGHPFCLFR